MSAGQTNDTPLHDHRGRVARRTFSFGLSGLSAQAATFDRASYGHELRRVVDLSVMAEEEGFDAVWVCEHHFSDDGFLPSPLVALGAIGERTSELTIGTDIILAPLWDPVRLAEDAAVVDQLCGGRLILGFGIGYRDVEFEGLGFYRKDRGARMDRCMEVLRAAWSGEPVGGLGVLPADSAVRVTPLPHQQAGPPVWIGGFAEAAVRRARRAGDGYIAPQIGPGGLSKRIAWLAKEAPLEGFPLAMSVIAFVGGRDAWKRVRPGMDLTEGQYRRWQIEAGDLPTLAGKPWDAGATEDTAPPAFVVGDPDTCIERLKPFVQAMVEAHGAGPLHLATRLTYPGIPDEDNDQSVRLYAREVMPALADYAAECAANKA